MRRWAACGEWGGATSVAVRSRRWRFGAPRRSRGIGCAQPLRPPRRSHGIGCAPPLRHEPPPFFFGLTPVIEYTAVSVPAIFFTVTVAPNPTGGTHPIDPTQKRWDRSHRSFFCENVVTKKLSCRPYTTPVYTIPMSQRVTLCICQWGVTLDLSCCAH